MPKFEKGVSGNPNGRPSNTKLDHRRLGANKLKKLLRALEPIADQSILTAAEIMNDKEASQATRLKAAMDLLKKYTDITSEVYFEQLPASDKGEEDEKDEEDSEESSAGGKLALLSSAKK